MTILYVKPGSDAYARARYVHTITNGQMDVREEDVERILLDFGDVLSLRPYSSVLADSTNMVDTHNDLGVIEDFIPPTHEEI